MESGEEPLVDLDMDSQIRRSTAPMHYVFMWAQFLFVMVVQVLAKYLWSVAWNFLSVIVVVG